MFLVRATQQGPSSSSFQRSSDGIPHSHGAGQSSFKSIKLDFPKFSGDDPLTWIFRAKQYFAYYGTPDWQRVVIASVNFEGDVVPWFQLLQRTRVITNWSSLIKAVEEEYGLSVYDKPRVRLFKLNQLTTADEYCREFMALANRTDGVSDEALLDCFTGGLKPEIRREVLAQKPTHLLRAAELAKLFDVKLGLGGPAHSWPNSFQSYSGPTRGGFTSKAHTTSGSSFTPSSSNITSPHSKTSLPPLLPTPPIKPLPNLKKMSPAEMLVRREKGLCYTCDEKFSPTHRCANKQYMLIDIDDVGDDLSSPTSSNASVSPPATDDNPSLHHLSLHAFQGKQGKATIRFQGTIQGLEVQILLDGGSSDCFLHPRIAHYLQLPIEQAPHVRVMIGGGHAMQGEGMIREIAVVIQGHTIRFPAFVLPIAGSDIVIGASWLATLGPTCG